MATEDTVRRVMALRRGQSIEVDSESAMIAKRAIRDAGMDGYMIACCESGMDDVYVIYRMKSDGNGYGSSGRPKMYEWDRLMKGETLSCEDPKRFNSFRVSAYTYAKRNKIKIETRKRYGKLWVRMIA